MENIDKIEKYPYIDSYWPVWLSWRRTSFQSLLSSESKLLGYVRNKCKLFFVPIASNTQYLRSLVASQFEKTEGTEKDDTMPILMLHGLGAGIGLWCKNIDAISDNRKLYAIDLLGFGFSSRSKFPKDPTHVENAFVKSIEEWRKALGLSKFILLGHSLGGYLAYSYAVKYPENVRHLILADPWGFSKHEMRKDSIRRSLLARMIIGFGNLFNPLAMVRFVGPLGPSLIKKARPDLGIYFKGDENEDNSVEPDDLFNYIYHCNAQYPSGEMAFRSLHFNVGWAYNPMLDRVHSLDKSVPITFIYGEHSWMDKWPALYFLKERQDSYVDLQVIPECGHHIYVQDSTTFNQTVNQICDKVDTNSDIAESAERDSKYEIWFQKYFKP